MELQKRDAAMSAYHTVAVLNEAHQVFLVQHQDTRKIYVKKQMEIYNPEVYRCLQQDPVPGVPRILECREEQGRLTVIEEYISGDSLEEKLQHAEISVQDIIRWMTELCEILERLHQRRPPVIHRDIKPSNVMITGSGRVVLLDFNAARQYSKDDAADTVLLGTQGYAAPEQYGFGASSPQTDIYAAGVLLRELLEKTSGDDRLRAIADRCTRISPEERYQSAEDLRSALTGAAASDAAMGSRERTDGGGKRGKREKGGKRGKSEKSEKSEKEESFLPPGFRTGTPWKMLISGIVYLIVFWMSLTLQVRDMTGGAVWLERITLLLMALSVIAGTCNYRNIQQFVPLCRMKNRFLRYLGILLLDFTLAAALFLIMLVLENEIFHV